MEPADLGGGQVAPGGGREAAERERSEAYPGELLHGVADRLAEPPHVMPLPLVDRDLEPGLGGQGFEHAGECGGGPAVGEPDAASEARERPRIGSAAHLGVVDAGDRLPGVEQRVGERTVVGEEQEPRGVQVESPDGVETLGDAADQGPHRRPALGIVQRAHHTARLVEEQRP